MTVKVMVPIYGDINYWLKQSERALSSICNQTLHPNSICISVSNCLYGARNKEGVISDCDYILFVDADDELDIKYIESMFKGTADIMVPTVHRYYEDGRIDKDQYWYKPVNLLERNYIVIGALIRTDLFKKIGGFRDLQLYEDWDLWLRMEEVGATFEQIPDAIYKIHVREGSRNEPAPEVKLELSNKIRNEAKKRRGLL